MKINYLSILCASVVLAGCASNSSNKNAQNVDSTASAATETKSESQVLDDGIDGNCITDSYGYKTYYAKK